MSGGFWYRLDRCDTSLVNLLQRPFVQIVDEIKDYDLSFTLNDSIAAYIVKNIVGQERGVNTTDYNRYALGKQM